jgi:hypothetical protein
VNVGCSMDALDEVEDPATTDEDVSSRSSVSSARTLPYRTALENSAEAKTALNRIFGDCLAQLLRWRKRKTTPYHKE